MFRKKPKFYKKTLFLFVLILFLLIIAFPSQPALAQEVNYCTQPGAVSELNVLSSTLQWGDWWSTASNINDSNEATYVGNYWQSRGFSRPIGFRYEAIVEFAQPTSQITRVEYRRSGGLSGNSYNEFLRTGSVPTGTLKTYLWYNDQWNEIYNEDMFVRVGSWQYYLPLATKVIQGDWSDVSKVKVEAYHSVYRWSLNYTGDSKIYEIRAFGPAPPPYQDIGLRVQAPSGTVSIAAEIGAPTSPLRIAKNGVIYGIALVDPGDPNDSGVRIQTSSGIKALRRL